MATFLRVDPGLNVEVYPDDEHVREEIRSPDTHDYIGIIERDLFRCLHHEKYDGEVCTIRRYLISVSSLFYSGGSLESTHTSEDWEP